jgi:hypothetical protein
VSVPPVHALLQSHCSELRPVVRLLSTLCSLDLHAVVTILCSAVSTADAHSKWITQLGMQSAAASTQHSIPPLVHVPPHLASSVLYGGQNFQGK